MPFSNSSHTIRRRQRRRKKMRVSDDRPRTVSDVLERKSSAGFRLRTTPVTANKQPQLASLDTEQPLTVNDSRYQVQTLRPIVSLAFVLPLIFIYELCAIYWGNADPRSGIDQWLNRIVSWAGFGQLVILPLLTTSALVVWHHRIKDHWKFNGFVLFGMLFESLALGTMLFCAASACNLVAGTGAISTAGSVLSFSELLQQPQWWTATIAAIGSGIYEELVFRLLLLIPVICLVKSACRSNQISMFAGALLVSLVFTALHYNVVNPAGAPIEIGSFFFRFVASIVFCFLFLFRGFGIAVGTHVAYDILAQL